MNTYTPQKHRIPVTNIDYPLLLGLMLLIGYGLVILFSASNSNEGMMLRQVIRLVIATGVMLLFAHIPITKYKVWTPWVYLSGILLLIAVLIMGKIGKGAQRWLDFGILRFQPSEILKVAVPMMIAWYFDQHPIPPKMRHLAIAAFLILLPGALIIKQPDLGTALMVIVSGGAVILFAGISWWIIVGLLSMVTVSAPIMWHFMHDYQRQRVLTFFNPERDPLGAGYHIIQSKIAIGSGGLFGKGWLLGTQSHLHFLPEHATDFIFAVCGEEFGLIGCSILIAIYLMIVVRCLTIAARAQDPYSRLLASGLVVSFFLSVFVNIGMVTGILPVVGLPLPLVSYGGTSMVTLMASFGIIMSIRAHKRLWPS